MPILLFVTIAMLWAAAPMEVARSEHPTVDRVVVEKAERRLMLMDEETVVRTYKISLGGNPVGHKQREGDNRTPEGHYVLDWRNPKSGYHKSLHVSYPNADDRKAAKARGENPGSDIMIHGQPNSMLDSMTIPAEMDWTAGCIAVSNIEIREIWDLVRDGTPIEIRP